LIGGSDFPWRNAAVVFHHEEREGYEEEEMASSRIFVDGMGYARRTKGAKAQRTKLTSVSAD